MAMIIMRDGSQKLISEERGQRLQNFLEKIEKPCLINLGSEKVRSTEISRVMPNEQYHTARKGNWSEVIRANLRIYKQTGKYGDLSHPDQLKMV